MKAKKKDSLVPYFMTYSNRKIYDFRTGQYVNLDQVLEQVSESNGEFEVSEKSFCDKYTLLLKALLEKEKSGRTDDDISILSRVIKEGGFIGYIKKLESKVVE